MPPLGAAVVAAAEPLLSDLPEVVFVPEFEDLLSVLEEVCWEEPWEVPEGFPDDEGVGLVESEEARSFCQCDTLVESGLNWASHCWLLS